MTLFFYFFDSHNAVFTNMPYNYWNSCLQVIESSLQNSLNKGDFLVHVIEKSNGKFKKWLNSGIQTMVL